MRTTLIASRYRLYLQIFLIIICLNQSSSVNPIADPSHSTEIVEDEYFEHISLSEGLSQGTVKCIFQDNRGFMWFGTQNGLNRYDGYTFKIFTNIPDDTTSITDNNINKIVEDGQGNLWIGTSNGFNKYNRQTETFENFFFEENITQNFNRKTVKNPKLSNVMNFNDNSVTEIHSSRYDKSGTLWIGMNNGLVEFDINRKTFSLFKPKIFGSNPYIIGTIIDDRSGNLLVNYNFEYKGYVLCFNKKTKEFTEIPELKSYLRHEQQENITKMFLDSRNILWIATNLRFICYNIVTKKIMEDEFDYLPRKSLITDIIEDCDANIWYTTNSLGLSKVNIKEKKIYQRLNDAYYSGSISYNTLFCCYFDRNNNMWIGTNGLGIDKNIGFSNRFNLVKGGSKNCPIKSVRCVIEDKNNNIWISGYNGFLLYRTNDNFLLENCLKKPDYFYKTSKYCNRSKMKQLRQLSDKNGLGYTYSDSVYGVIYAMTNDLWDKNAIWLGVEGIGLQKFYIKDIIFERIPLDNGDQSIRGGYISSLLSDEQGNIWVGTEKGLNKFNQKNNSYKFYCNNNDSNSISPGSVKVIYKDQTGTYWIGSDIGGLNRLDINTGCFKHYRFNKNINNCISSNTVLSIYEDSRKRFWIGTNNGLNYMDRQTGLFNSFTTSNGLPNNTIYGILEDDKGCLWLSTNKGLSRFNPDTKMFYNFSVKDGLQSVEFNTNSYFKTRDGELFFGGVNGFNHFYPSQIFDTTNISNMVLTDFIIFDKQIKIGEKIGQRVLLSKSITETDEIVLNYDENMITFEYALLSYCNPGKIQYKYILRNFNNKWIFTTDRKVTFTNLDPGDYTFTIIGSSSEGQWSQNGASIRIIIRPPFWTTWWFRSLIVIFLISAILMIYKMRVREIKKRQIELEIQVIDRTKDLLNEKEKTEQLYNKSEQLLLNVLPEPIAIRLKDGEKPIADHFEEASVIFIDIADFTQLSSRSTPEEIVNMLNDIFSTFEKITVKYGLEKIKTIGDCFMAASGIPVPREDYAQATALMALEAMNSMKDYKTFDGNDILFRIGLDCGPTVAGVIGEQKFIYDLWGDMVNTASRMESSGIIGKIQCTERFKEKLQSTDIYSMFRFNERGEIEIKGKGLMKTYLLEANTNA